MVEAAGVDPRFRGVARFAAQGSSVGALRRHALLEFALVGIGVAGGACAVLKMERQNLVRSPAEPRLVALRAGDRYVGTRQDEARVLVFGNCECRTMKILYGVAILATILVGSGGKLLVMGILVAIRAGREFHLGRPAYDIYRRLQLHVFPRADIAMWRAPSPQTETASSLPRCGTPNTHPCWPALGTGPCEDRVNGSSRIGRKREAS
jgi:hypothetical protein